jgi:hypothetical protein
MSFDTLIFSAVAIFFVMVTGLVLTYLEFVEIHKKSVAKKETANG